MKHKNSIHRLLQFCSATSTIIASMCILKDNVQIAIFGILLAIHLNMLSWNYEDCNKEE